MVVPVFMFTAVAFVDVSSPPSSVHPQRGALKGILILYNDSTMF